MNINNSLLNELETLNFKFVVSYKKNKQLFIIYKDMNGFYFVSRKDRIGNALFVSKDNKYSCENIRLWCNLNNKPFILLSNQYINAAYDKLKWKCLNENCEEHFESTWSNVKSGCECPYCCKNPKASSKNCLATKNPELASEWHPTKNGNLTPYDVLPNSNIKRWWICKKNNKHVWFATINSRNQNTGCPYCRGFYASEDYNLLVVNPKLCIEWNYEKNKKSPQEYTPYSEIKVWWQCDKGHEWEAKIKDRNKGHNCIYCAGQKPTKENNLLVFNPKLCEDWDYNKNEKIPEDYCPNSNKKVWWKCKDCGYEWWAIINSRNKGNGCLKCSQSTGEKQIEKFLLENNYNFEREYSFFNLIGINGGLLRFDFVLFDFESKTKIKCLIEYDGQFHYKKQYKNDGYETLIIHDKMKDEYCLNYNINLVRINYLDFDRIEEILEKELNLLD